MPSLAVRAGLIFLSIYTVIVVAFLTVAAISNSAESGGNRHGGAYLALGYAAEDIEGMNGPFALPSDGKLRELASRNPSLWLLGRRGRKTISFGPVPAAALDLVDPRQGDLQSVRFEVPHPEPLLRAAAMRRYDFGGEPVLLAAGGVDRRLLTAREASPFFAPGGLMGVLLVIGLVGFAAMLIALPLMARALRPITAEAGALHPRDSDRRLDERKAPRELLPLVRAFNAALDRLATELGRRKRFVADVAHELRTPLAVLSLRVDALKDEEAKEELRSGLGRITHLVSQMLDLERLSLAGRQRAPIELAEVARNVVADLAPMALKAGYDLSLDAPAVPVTVNGDRHAVERAITNLIGNAIAHAGGAGNIRVGIGPDRTLDVSDEGPGVSVSLRPRLFEPFCRDSANSESCGLGLHLTREIMRAHGGDVRLLPTGQGATFRLEFPALPERRTGLEAEDAVRGTIPL
jgi:signal transduction histidine kinase